MPKRRTLCAARMAAGLLLDRPVFLFPILIAKGADMLSGDEITEFMHGNAHPDALSQAKDRIDALRRELQACENELDHLRRQAAQRLAHAGLYGIMEFASSLLPMMDSLERAQAIQTTDVAAFRQGLALTLQQMRKALSRAGMHEILPVAGESFDPHLHVAEGNAWPVQSGAVVAAVLQKGYRIHDKIVRPAVVKLANRC